MDISEVADQYFTYQDRLASFQVAHPLPTRRGSTVNSKAKPLKWPHKFLSADALAKAGFFYHPLEANPDNVACFLCHKFLDGWEKGDDPLQEHLTLSPNCGWAILATIEAQEQDLSEHNPLAPEMVAARKATFANKWPYESKKAWKCKTKQMVDAGWMYTPMPESDDMATCVYCQLALDGWEPSDKPWDEHYARSPSCSFFLLAEENKQTKSSKTKKDRVSKASRLSTQSAFTTASEAPSLADLPGEEDSILTTVTTASTTGGRKMAKEKKASTRGRKAKAKKSEAVEIEQPEPEKVEGEVKANPKAKSGRKRKSEEVVDIDTPMLDAEAPPPKRRNTRTRESTAIDESISNMQAHEEVDQQPTASRRRGRSSAAKPVRKASASKKESLDAAIPNDEEIDRALAADLERQLTDEEDHSSIQLPKRAVKSSKNSKTSYEMFDPEPPEIDEAAIEAEMETMELESKPLPKPKGGKAKTTRKISAKQQAAAKKKAAAAVAAAVAAAEAEAEAEVAAQLINESLHSIPEPVVEPAPTKGKRVASQKHPQQPPAKNTKQSTSVEQHAGSDDNINMRGDSILEGEDSVVIHSPIMQTTQSPSEGVSKKGQEDEENIDEAPDTVPNTSAIIKTDPPPARPIKSKKPLKAAKKAQQTDNIPAPEPEQAEDSIIPEAPETRALKARGRQPKPAAYAPQPNTSTEGAPRSPSPSPREATPSQSPQSSDAENHPPSSRPSMAKSPLPPVSSSPQGKKTPTISPSKRNVISGLQSTEPWTAVDLDTFLISPESKGNGLFDRQIESLKNGQLASPEKKMTVEEWIYHNAQLAEEKLRNDCERMVGDFEREGGRAMKALEGIICNE